MSVKAIETIYNGYRFRSRLEARWAVFFDTLGVQYIYEREGFDLDGTRYLPDFWLPDFNSWLEIKGVGTSESSAKAFALAKHTGKLVFMFSDCLPPEMKLDFHEVHSCNDSPDVIIRNYGYYYAPDGDYDGMMAFGFCSNCNSVTLGHIGAHPVFCNEIYEHYQGGCTWLGRQDLHPRIIAAYTAACSARFEHGERGRP